MIPEPFRSKCIFRCSLYEGQPCPSGVRGRMAAVCIPCPHASIEVVGLDNDPIGRRNAPIRVMADRVDMTENPRAQAAETEINMPETAEP